jgi:hypothetical protein
MTLLLIIAVIVIVPWVAVVAVALAVLHQGARVRDRYESMCAHPVMFQPCPQCHLEGAALVDSDGVALCVSCGCSWEAVAL